MSMIASVLVGARGQVHAFEPHPEVFKRLKLAISLGAFGNVKLNELLLGERPGKMTFFLNPRSPSSSSLSARWAPAEKLVEIEREAIDLDSYWGSCARMPVDLIKLDVEGFEFPVLRGAQELILSNHPLLLLEINNPNSRYEAFGYTVEDMLLYLSRLGYSFYALRQFRLDLVSNGSDIQDTDHDILCVHENSRLYKAAATLIQNNVSTVRG